MLFEIVLINIRKESIEILSELTLVWDDILMAVIVILFFERTLKWWPSALN